MPGTAFSAANWSNACTATLQQLPASDLSAFTHGIDISRLTAAWKAAVQSDGGDIRVTDADNNELPFDLYEWAYNAGAPTGTIFVKADTSSSTAVVVRVWAGYTPGTAVAYDADETSGSDNAYDRYHSLFWPSGGGTDRTANGRDATAEGGVTVGGATGANGESATSFDGTDDQTTVTSVPLSGVTSWETVNGEAITGLDRDTDRNTLWYAEFDVTDERLVEVSLDGVATGNDIDLTGTAPQGVAFDSSDNTLWVVVSGGTIESYSRDGTHNSGSDISFANARGVAYEAATDTLWVTNNTSTVTRINKSGVTQESFSVTGLTEPDGIFYDAAEDELFICDDEDAQSSSILVVDASDGSVKRTIIVADWVEDCTLDADGNLIFSCDATFHDSPLNGNRVFTAADRGVYSATLSLWLAGSPTLSGTDALLGLGNAVGSSSADWGINLTMTTTTNARPFMKGDPDRVFVDKTVATGACKLTAVYFFSSGEIRLYQNGVEVGSISGTGVCAPLDSNDNTDDPYASKSFEFGVGNVPSGDTDRFTQMTASMTRFSYTARTPVWDLQEYRWETDQSSYWGTFSDVSLGLPEISSVVMDADGIGGTITFDESVASVDVADFTLNDEFGTDKNITNLSGSGTTRTFDCDPCHKGISLTLDYSGADLEDVTDFNVDESAIALTARITRYTTTATKTAGMGCVSLTARNTTLGDGVQSQHRYQWEMTSYPAGYSYTITDPRPGLQLGDTINARDGDWEGYHYSFPIDEAGSYTVQLTVTDENGNQDTDEVTVVVAAQSSPTTIWLDGGATGSNDGTSETDAYTSADTALAALVSAGNNSILEIVGGQTYAPTSDRDLNGAENVIVRWSGGGGTKPVIDLAGAEAWLKLKGQNITLDSVDFVNTDNDDTGICIGFGNSQDAYINNCDVITGGRLRSFHEETHGGIVRALFRDIDTSIGVYTQSGAFGEFQQLAIAGGYYGNIITERPFRLNEAAGNSETASVFVGVRIECSVKDPLRIQDGNNHSIFRSKLVVSGNGNNCILLGSGTNVIAAIQVDRCYLSSEGASTQSCIATDPDITDPDANVTVRASWLRTTESTNTSEVLDLDAPERCFVIGNLLQSGSDSVNKAVALDSNAGVEVFSSNLLQMLSEVVDGGTDKSYSINSTATCNDNTLVDAANITNSSKYRIDGIAASLASVNALTDASGNTETDSVTIDANGFPSAYEDATCPPGLFADYYGTAVTVGETIDRGMAQEESGDAAPTVNAVRFAFGGTKIRVSFSEAVTGTTGFSVDSGTITYEAGSGTASYFFTFTGSPTTVSYSPGNVVDSIGQALGAFGPTTIDEEISGALKEAASAVASQIAAAIAGSVSR